MKVGLIGWRGMVGSVLLQRMQAERDFDLIDPTFFSTSQAGARGPALGGQSQPLKDARKLDELARMDVLISCQGGDYTNEIHPKLRGTGWDGYWIDAASALRMQDDAIIILDPVNMDVIKAGLKSGVKNYIGGNCTVSLMLMAMGGLFKAGLVEWMTAMTYQAASGAGAAQMRELVQQMGVARDAARALLDDPASAIIDIDRAVAEVLRRPDFPGGQYRPAARGQPAAVDRQGSRQRPEPRGVERHGRDEQDTRQGRARDSRRRHLRARRRHALPQPGVHGEAHARLVRCPKSSASSAPPTHGSKSFPTNAKRRCGSSHLPRSPARSTCRSGGCASCRWAENFWPHSRSATSSCGARRSRCAACCAYSSMRKALLGPSHRPRRTPDTAFEHGAACSPNASRNSGFQR